MKFTTGRQFGLGNRKYTLTEDFNFFNRGLPKGLTVDGSSVPKVAIMFIAAVVLLWGGSPVWLESLIIVVMLLVGISESSGWFMKPAAVHDYRFQNASSSFGWIPANFEYWWLMMLKINEFKKTNPNKNSFIKMYFHIIMGSAIALSHLVMLMLFGWIVWGKYFLKNKKLAL
ncbi:MAG: hypothetical protein GXP22_00565 [Gammaproteobacteria bacterium]|nr:hypothetical protein [Gammaproteobacteria bacterium]